MSEHHNELMKTAELSKLSQVSHLKHKREISKATRIGAIALIVCLIGVSYLTSKAHSQQREQKKKSSTSNNAMLQENLTALERMQQEQLAQKNHVPNYTSTPDGEKIGNPKAFRASPPQREEIDPELATRINAPTTFFIADKTASNGHQNPDLGSYPVVKGSDANSAFLNTKNDIETVNATKLLHPEYTIIAGEMIPATLETAINSDLPGMARAIVTRDVYSLTGNHVLIPKGSQLIGPYSSGNIAAAQTRILASWTRVQMPNGVVVSLNSPSTDSLGRGGMGADSVDRHFWERFSTGFLYSVLGATTALVGVHSSDEFNSASQYRMAIANNLEQSARDSVQGVRSIQSTLQINQGTTINVFVARDLDFYQVARGNR